MGTLTAVDGGGRPSLQRVPRLGARATVALLTGTAVTAWLVALALAWFDGTAELHRHVATGIGIVLPYLTVGVVIATRLPSNPLGWCFLAVGSLSGASNLATAWAIRGLVSAPGSLPLAAEAAWLSDLIWWPPLVIVLTWLVLLVPDGRLPSRAWRAVSWATGGGLAASVLVLAVATWPQRGSTFTTASAAPVPPWAAAVAATGAALLVVSIPACAAALVGRYRRANGADRDLLRWFLVAAAAALLGIVGVFVLPPPAYLVAAVGAGVFPALTVAAVLRHGMLGLEVVVRRSLVGAGLSACLAAVYVAASGSVSVIVGRTAPLPTAVLAGTVAAILVEPARMRIQRAVDRLVHGASAVDAAALAAELQRTREELVSTREEERRRLRRDLHDGLGPTLATIGVGLQAAIAQQPAGPVADVLRRNLAEADRAMATVRGLVEGLRPPALDRLGLEGAIVEAAGPLLADRELTTEFDLGPDPLPAAVEVAAYRIVLEAVTNVARHAAADRCTVSLRRAAGAVHVLVQDDGVGLTGTARAGLGTASMRERAEELGGWCRIEPTGHGTRVTASLPTGAPS